MSLFQINIKTLQNLEPVLEAELREFGAADIVPGRRIVSCTVDQKILYKLNLHLRTALRILVPVAEFPIREADDIYKQALRIDWTKYLNLEQTFAIDPNVNALFIKHSNYASLRLKDAIADSFNQKFGKRPDVHPENPDVLFNLHVDNHRVTISLDSSGESLNRRGYRERGAKAPLNEVLAAGMILLTGWRGETDFYDPMCGSGTLPIEASMIAQNLPAQFLRSKFGFMRWKDFDAQLWKEVKQEASAGMRKQPCRIIAMDADPRQLRSAKINIELAGFEDDIEIALRDFTETSPISEQGILIINPPYGERIEEENLLQLYKNIGDHLKKAWSGHQAWIISSNREAMNRIGLKPSKKIPLINGTYECRFQQYQLFRGSRKDHVVSQL